MLPNHYIRQQVRGDFADAYGWFLDHPAIFVIFAVCSTSLLGSRHIENANTTRKPG